MCISPSFPSSTWEFLCSNLCSRNQNPQGVSQSFVTRNHDQEPRQCISRGLNGHLTIWPVNAQSLYNDKQFISVIKPKFPMAWQNKSVSHSFHCLMYGWFSLAVLHVLSGSQAASDLSFHFLLIINCHMRENNWG